MSSKDNDIIAFFTGQSTPTPTLSKILSWDDRTLELRHDFIQILFPLPEASMINFRAPTVTAEVFEAFRANDEQAETMQANLRHACERMMKFYGLNIQWNVEPYDMVQFTPDAAQSNPLVPTRRWLGPFNHNHMRITRIIRSMRVLGLEDEALGIYAGLEKLAVTWPKARCSERSRLFWSRAALRPLHMAPNDHDGAQDFLRRSDQEEKVLTEKANAIKQRLEQL